VRVLTSIENKGAGATLSRLFADLMARQQDEAHLDLEVQRSLGAALRAEYRDIFAHHLPERFVRLLLPLRALRGRGRRDAEIAREPSPLFMESNFDPDTIAVLTESLAEGWDTLRYIRNTTITREALAKRLLELARTGERNPSRLCTAALVALLADVSH
jgi:hypothetical protein